jgi:hypothetical protein
VQFKSTRLNIPIHALLSSNVWLVLIVILHIIPKLGVYKVDGNSTIFFKLTSTQIRSNISQENNIIHTPMWNV